MFGDLDSHVLMRFLTAHHQMADITRVISRSSWGGLGVTLASSQRSLGLVGLFWRPSGGFKIGDLGLDSGCSRDDLATAGRLKKWKFSGA